MLSYLRSPKPEARSPKPEARSPKPEALSFLLHKAALLVLFAYHLISYKLRFFLTLAKNITPILLSYVLIHNSAIAQSCATAGVNNKIFTICGNNCTNIKLTVQNLRNTSDYSVKTKAYIPYSFTSSFGFEDPRVYNWQAFSNLLLIPFTFCFYDSSYNKLVSSSNGVITFDTSNAALLCASAFQNAFSLPNTIGVQCSGNGYSPKASIFTAHCNLDPRIGPSLPSPPDRKIEFRTEGTAPCRRFIVSYYKIGNFGTNDGTLDCWPDKQNIFQTVLYEGSNIIEMYIEKFICPPNYGSGGRATLGLQNWNRDKAICAPGKNAQVWPQPTVQEAYQFNPNGSTRFINSGIYTLNGTFIKNADTSSNIDGTLNLQFTNICPPNDTTKYIVKTNYSACTGVGLLTYQDTILLVKNNSISATLFAPNSCSGDTGRTVIVNAGGDNFTYALNGGTPQVNNTFVNLPNGLNFIQVNGTTSGCTALLSSFIGGNNLILQSIKDTAICLGNTVNLFTTSNGTQYNWQPATGLSNNSIASPVATPLNTTSYVVTATQGFCIKKDTVTITVLPKPFVNAGTDITIISGEDAQLNGTVFDAVNFSWSPLSFLNSGSILNPIVLKPSITTLYKLTATTANGCIANDEVLLTVLPYCVQIKNAFTPNGDGINDFWQVYSGFSCLQNVAVKIYNRYGGLIYQNNNYTNNWDGTFNGKPVTDGTYYFVVNYTFITGKKIMVKGDLTVLR